jgi:hypothetical protein
MSVADGGDILTVDLDQGFTCCGLILSLDGEEEEGMILSLVLSRSSSYNRIISERAQLVSPGRSSHPKMVDERL